MPIWARATRESARRHNRTSLVPGPATFKHWGSAVRVLLAEDDEPVAESLRRGLERYGFDVE